MNAPHSAGRRRALLALGGATLLAGCGFQLRGARPLPFDSIYLNMYQYSELAAAIRRQIRANGNTIVGNVRTLTVAMKARLNPIERVSRDAPDFRVTSGAAEVGAGWNSVSAKIGRTDRLKRGWRPCGAAASRIADHGGLIGVAIEVTQTPADVVVRVRGRMPTFFDLGQTRVDERATRPRERVTRP